MKRETIFFLKQLEGFKTCCKNMHFSAQSMSEHKLFDEIAELLANKQDEIGEIEQGLHGQFGKKTIKEVVYISNSSKKFIQDVIKATHSYYKQIKGDEYIGMRSSVEDFLAKLNKLPYLLNLTLKEDFKRSFKSKINESRMINDGFEVDENVLYSALNEAFTRVLNKKTINEAFKSQQLKNTLTQARAAYHEPRSNNHSLRNLSTQGLGYSGDAEAPGYMKDKRHSMYSSNYLDQITDDMISDTGTRDELEKKGYRFGGHETLYGIGSQDVYDANGEKRYAIPANAGYYIILNNDNSTKSKIQNLSSQAYKKYTEREDNRRYSDSDRQYYPMTPKAYAAREYRTNPYPWAKKNGSKDPENGWDNEARKNAMSNIRNGIDSQGIDPRKYVSRFDEK